jgi:dTDP-4-dehydrorhamnose reductase
MINKIFIFGATGMLGHYIYSYFKNKIEIINIEYRVYLENFEDIIQTNRDIIVLILIGMCVLIFFCIWYI